MSDFLFEDFDEVSAKQWLQGVYDGVESAARYIEAGVGENLIDHN